jgi:hypothetical protein
MLSEAKLISSWSNSNLLSQHDIILSQSENLPFPSFGKEGLKKISTEKSPFEKGGQGGFGNLEDPKKQSDGASEAR